MTRNAYQFKVLLHLQPFDRNLKGSFKMPILSGYGSWRSLGVGICTNRKPTSQYKRLRYLPSFGSYLYKKIKLCASRGEELGGFRGSGVAPIKSSHTTYQYLSTKFCSICCRLAGIPRSNHGPSIRPHLVGLGWT